MGPRELRLINLLLITISLLLSCNSVFQPSHDYYEVNACHITFGSLLEQKAKIYDVYFYKSTCEHCNQIKDQIIGYALNSPFVPINFIEESHEVSLGLDTSTTIGKSDIQEIFISGYPSLIHIAGKQVKNNIVGAIEILAFLKI